MKLYMHPASTTSRPVMLCIADNKLNIEQVVIDLLTGEHHQPAYSAINPNKLVPLLEDGDFRLSESSAILKYLADKFNLAVYPKDLQQRARVNEMMDWFNTQFSREFCYGLTYSQLLPHHKRPNEVVQQGTIEWARTKAEVWLDVLDNNLIGPKNNWLCGKEKTIADYFGGCLITLGEVIGCDFSAYPIITRWLKNLKSLPSWAPVNDTFYGWVNSVKGQQFTAIGR